MAETTAEKLEANTVVCQIEDVTFDIAGESKPLMSMGEHTSTDFKSQKINDTTIANDGKWQPVTLIVTFNQADYDTIKGYWETARSDLTYTVSGGLTGIWTNCSVFVSETPSTVPHEKGYVTCSVTIKCNKREIPQASE